MQSVALWSWQHHTTVHGPLRCGNYFYDVGNIFNSGTKPVPVEALQSQTGLTRDECVLLHDLMKLYSERLKESASPVRFRHIHTCMHTYILCTTIWKLLLCQHAGAGTNTIQQSASGTFSYFTNYSFLGVIFLIVSSFDVDMSFRFMFCWSHTPIQHTNQAPNAEDKDTDEAFKKELEAKLHKPEQERIRFNKVLQVHSAYHFLTSPTTVCKA